MSEQGIPEPPVQPPGLPSVPHAPIGLVPAPPEAPAPPITPSPPVTEPETGTPEAMPDMGKLAWLIVLLGLIALAAALVEAFNNFVRWMLGPLWPRTGKRAASAQQFTQWISSPLGSAYTQLDQDIGASFTKLAQLTSRVGAAIVSAETRLYRMATRVGALAHSQAVGQVATASAASQAKHAQQAATAAHAAAAVTARQAAAADAATAAAVSALATHITRVIEPELNRLRHEIPSLEKGQATLWDVIEQHSEALGITAMTATVAVALGGLGAEWIRCETNGQVGNKLCNTNPDLLRKLLHGGLDILGILELCAMLKLIVATGNSSVVTGALTAFSQGLEALLTCSGATRPTPLRIPAPSVAPPMPWATLAPNV